MDTTAAFFMQGWQINIVYICPVWADPTARLAERQMKLIKHDKTIRKALLTCPSNILASDDPVQWKQCWSLNGH